MQKEMSTGESIYNLVELLIEMEIDNYITTGKRTSEKIGNYILENRKEQIDRTLKQKGSQ